MTDEWPPEEWGDERVTLALPKVKVPLSVAIMLREMMKPENATAYFNAAGWPKRRSDLEEYRRRRASAVAGKR